ncbi:MAG: DNA polymerase III subunit delta' [Clostridiales bacterium]|nr:DNA polymerase III subunit delta' [Candidatus Cacconaster stercorequi]
MAQMLAKDSDLARQICALSRQRVLPHAVILSGAGDRLSAARFLAAAMVCRDERERPCLACGPCRKVAQEIHPDVHIVQDTERRELSVDSVRELRKDVYIYPNEGEQKVYIFADCQQLNERDQNVLLKIVEEGPPYAAFIFCTESTATLLPTIRSRCVELKLRQEDAQQESEQVAALCKALAGAELLPVASFLVALENQKPKREQVQQLLQDTWRIAAQALAAQCGGAAASASAEHLSRSLNRRQLQRLTELLKKYSMECNYNVGAGHILGAVCAEWEEIL